MQNTKPTVVIVAAGKNSRFFPLGTSTHKGFTNLVGSPICLKTLKNLEQHGYEKAVLVVSEKDYAGNGFSGILPKANLKIQVEFVLQQEAEGMGEAILAAKDHIKTDFIVSSPYYINLGVLADNLLEKKTNSSAKAVLSGTRTDNPSIFGILKLSEDHNRVLGLVEKPKKENAPSEYKIDSVYLFEKDFLSALSEIKKAEYAFETAIDKFVSENEVAFYENTTPMTSLKYAWNLFDTTNEIFALMKSFVAESANVAKTAVIDESHGPVFIDEEAIVGDFAKIVGPAYIGRGALVGDYSFVRHSTIEKSAVVGANTEVVRSIILANSSIHYSYLADSILGEGTKVGAGLITANKRLDRANVKTKIKGSMVDSGLRALGIITGEGVNIGIRVNSMPGILLGSKSLIYPSNTIGKNLSEGEKLK